MQKIQNSPMGDLLNQDIRIKEIIDKNGLDFMTVACHLFPTNKHPRLALNRIIAGEAFLDSNQMSKLAAMANISIAELYGAKWKAGYPKDDVIVFTSNTFRAELNTKTWLTKIFDNGSLFHEAIITSGSTALSEYIQELNSIISKHKS